MPLLDSRVEDSWDVCSQNAAYMSWGRASVTYKQCIYMSMLLELLSFDHDSELSSVWPPFQHFSVETEFFVVPWPSRKTTLSPIHRRANHTCTLWVVNNFEKRIKWLVLDVKVGVSASSATNVGPCSARTSLVSTTTPRPPAAVVHVENPGDRKLFRSW